MPTQKLIRDSSFHLSCLASHWIWLPLLQVKYIQNNWWFGSYLFHGLSCSCAVKGISPACHRLSGSFATSFVTSFLILTMIQSVTICLDTVIGCFLFPSCWCFSFSFLGQVSPPYNCMALMLLVWGFRLLKSRTSRSLAFGGVSSRVVSQCFTSIPMS